MLSSGKNGNFSSKIENARHGSLKPPSHSHSISASFGQTSFSNPFSQSASKPSIDNRKEEIGIADLSTRKLTGNTLFSRK
jgi:hypothetical protein